MSSVLSREQAGSVRLWNLPDVGGTTVNPSVPSRRSLRQLVDTEQQAREEGFATGLAQGREAAQRELTEKVGYLQSIIEQLERPLAELDHQIEHDLVLLATKLAAQVVRHQLKIDPDQIIPVVQAALSALPSSARHIKIHLHPADAELVRAKLMNAEDGHTWQISEDLKVSRGGCRISSESSIVDATVEARLDAAIHAVLDIDDDEPKNRGVPI